jgi:hypothetical protein
VWSGAICTLKARKWARIEPVGLSECFALIGDLRKILYAPTFKIIFATISALQAHEAQATKP